MKLYFLISGIIFFIIGLIVVTVGLLNEYVLTLIIGVIFTVGLPISTYFDYKKYKNNTE